VGAIERRRAIVRPPLVAILTGEQPGVAPAEDTMSEPRSHASEPVSSVPAHVRQLGKVHHVAVVVRSIDASLGLWRDTLGLPVELVLPIDHDRVTIAFLPVGESKIELVQPDDESIGVARFLAKRGEGFHHVCFEVSNISEALMRLEMDGIELIDSVARKGAEGPVAFLHPNSCQGVLVELIEAPGGPAWAALGY
jgi:methylmalonyl-CoA/ethylmalonyl-CoA epimerase